MTESKVSTQFTEIVNENGRIFMWPNLNYFGSRGQINIIGGGTNNNIYPKYYKKKDKVYPEMRLIRK